MRISAHNLNHTRTALKHRAVILENSLSQNDTEVKVAEDNIWGEGVKIVKECRQNRKPFTQAEKEDFKKRYEAGASMGEIARLYKCHHTTVGSILRRMGAKIR